MDDSEISDKIQALKSVQECIFSKVQKETEEKEKQIQEIEKKVKEINGIQVTTARGGEGAFREIVDKGYNLLKSDKNLRKDFNNILIDGVDKLKKHPEFKKVYEAFEEEYVKVLLSGSDKKAINEALNNHFKKGFIPTWGRNLTFDILKIKARKPINKLGLEMPEELKINYGNYKTFWNTIAAIGLPVFGSIIAVPYAFNAWLTNIQKKAGKIGIMKAMEKIDDPRLYVNENESSKTVAEPATIQKTQNSTKLLDKFKSI